MLAWALARRVPELAAFSAHPVVPADVLWVMGEVQSGRAKAGQEGDTVARISGGDGELANVLEAWTSADDGLGGW